MTLYSVQRYRATVLRMYLRIAVVVTFFLSALYFLFDVTPDRGAVPFIFGLFALWLQRYTRHDIEKSLNFANWFILVIMGLMLYGSYTSDKNLHQEVWMMIFPITFAPIVSARERIIWGVVGAVSLASMALFRPDPLTAISVSVYVIAYLNLSFVTMMLVRHNELNIERLAHLSIIDPLTKAYNRGYMKDILLSEINRCKRSGQSLTLIMLDIDHFKMLNDSYGHLHGDHVLEKVVEVLKQTAQRAGDYVFRYGGEEFCVLSSGLATTEALQFAEKLRISIRELGIENKAAPKPVLTASAGFWCVSDMSEITADILLMSADNALYRAKEAGRDTVVDFTEIPTSGLKSGQIQGVPA